MTLKTVEQSGLTEVNGKSNLTEQGNTTEARRVHLGFIDGIRALAALYVLLGHVYFEPANGYYPSHIMKHIGLSYGHLAVDVFIVVSGFCLMLPIAQRGDQMGALREFFHRRARRILPPYYAALLLSILFIATVAHATDTGTIWDVCPPLTGATVLRHVFLVHDLSLLFVHTLPTVNNGQISYPLWSIAVEAQVYLFMPLVVGSLRRWGNAPTLLWTIGFGLVLDRWLEARIADACPWYLGLFCCGAIAAREGIKVKVEVGALWRWAAYAMSALTLITVLVAGNKRFRAHPMLFDDIAGISAALLLYVLLGDAGKQRHRLSRLLTWPPLVSLGLFSYSLYLLHAPLLHACYLAINALLHPGLTVMFFLLFACTPLVIAASYGFFLLFERPFLPQRR